MTQGEFGPEGINKPVKKYELWFIRFTNKVVKNNQVLEIVYFLIFQAKDFAFAPKHVWREYPYVSFVAILTLFKHLKLQQRIIKFYI
jgi:hypothetical protein